MSREVTIKAIDQHKVFAIVRGLSPEHIRPTMDALYRGGIRLVEVTFDRVKGDEATLSALKILGEEYNEKLMFGAGTVTTIEQVQHVKKLGGQFVVSPDFNEDVVTATREAALVSLPGVMTATEAVAAHRAGADFIKLFPGGLLGPEYLKALTAPLSDLKFIVVGGVSDSNLEDFSRAGAAGFGIGSNLVNNALVEQEAFDTIYLNACAYKQALDNL